MPRVTCRCGEKLKVPHESPEHMDLHSLRRKDPAAPTEACGKLMQLETDSSGFCAPAGAD